MSAAPSGSSASGTGVGVEVLSPNGGSAPVVAKPAFAPVSDLPAATGAKDPNYGLKTVAPTNNSALPVVEKPTEAPDQINEAGKNQLTPQEQAAAAKAASAKGNRHRASGAPGPLKGPGFLCSPPANATQRRSRALSGRGFGPAVSLNPSRGFSRGGKTRSTRALGSAGELP
jgi:hypothetical protein